jgi:DNA polymerase-3 subunit gamma/tau
MPDPVTSPADRAANGGSYVVVARRYRPQTFDELVGQEHVAKALKGAITSDRVGHAYLFTGARGVGKTSAARILAKALNCEQGPTPTPCNECEICRSVTAGDDLDVIEIDGASNNGVDEVRALRQNANVRPSRARYKIYIIDEVHMLSKSAFNALLKTLEEPPEHVKFIFATTEPNKIPITILSRCQKFDFAGIDAASIQQQLAKIAAAEGVEAEADALAIIAMRAAGSMRDSQSLLEQLLATGVRNVTAGDVTDLLGLAPAGRLSRLIQPLVDHDAAAALTELDAAIHDGAEPGQLIDQLLGYFRDAMTQAVGCSESQMLYALPGQREEIRAIAQRLGVHTLLAISQILDQAAARMRISTQVRTLAEMAVVRICHLQDLDDIAALVDQLKDGSVPASATPVRPAPPATPAKKNGAVSNPVQPPAARVPLAPPVSESPSSITLAEPAPDTAEASTAEPIALDAESVEPVWKRTLDRLTGLVADSAAAASKLSVDATGRLVASFPASRKFSRDSCLRPANLSRIESALAEVCGRSVGLVLTTHDDPADAAPPLPKPTLREMQASVAAQPFVQRAMELFDADASKLRFAPADEQN